MDSPRMTRRSRASVCYKEDSFVEEDSQKKRPVRANGRKSIVKRTVTPQPIVVLRDINMEDDVISSPTRRRKSQPSGPVTPRRSIRPRKKPELVAPKEGADESSEDDEETCETPDRPTELFAEDDVEGKRMFGFKKNYRKQSLLKKAIETMLESPLKKLSISTPKTPQTTPITPKRRGRPSRNLNQSMNVTPTTIGTPKSARVAIVPKTPHRLRNKMKKELQMLVLSEEGSDFSASGSDFCPSDDNEESEENIDTDNESVTSSEECKPKISTEEKTTSRPYTLRSRGEKDNNFIVKSDDYFNMQSSKKIVTSNRTLDRLKNPRLTEEKLRNILKKHTISKEHMCAIEELVEDHQKLFDKWLFVLSEGFSILLHGVGSKMKLIRDFQLTKLNTDPCLVINGFFPSLTLKDIVDAIALDMLDLNSVPSNVNEAIEVIEEELSEWSDTNFFLLVHNIDGSMLKNNKTQHFLSKLSRMPNVHLIASLDHINGPLYWDHVKLHDYNFSWWDVTTFLPYTQETSFENSLLVNNSGTLALSSLQNVFHSLTTNTKGIFMIIAKNQLKNKKTPHYQGISFKELYWSARENFLVSSDLALRAQLTEFIDHKLVRNRRTVDGVENMTIPIDDVLLQQFIDQHED